MDPLLGLQVVFNLQRFYEYRLIVTTISSIMENFKMGLVTLVIVFLLKSSSNFPCCYQNSCTIYCIWMLSIMVSVKLLIVKHAILSTSDRSMNFFSSQYSIIKDVAYCLYCYLFLTLYRRTITFPFIKCLLL